jgi:hypothetical protein
LSSVSSLESFAEPSILFEFKEGENFNNRNILNISRLKFEPDAEIGQKGGYAKLSINNDTL